MSAATTPPLAQDSKVRTERHRELWSASSQNFGRFVIGGLLLGVVVLESVTAPFVSNSVALDQALGREQLVAQEIVRIEEQQDGLAASEGQLREIENVVQARPWDARVNALRASFADMRQAYETLQGRHSETRKIWDPVDQAALIEVLVPSPIQGQPVWKKASTAGLSRNALDVLQTRPKAMLLAGRRTALDTSIPDGFSIPVPTPEGPSSEVLARLGPDDPGQALRPLAEASARLQIDEQVLRGVSPERWDVFLLERATELTRGLAKEALLEMTSAVEDRILRPLEALIQSPELALRDLEAVEESIEEARKELDELSNQGSSGSWADSFDGKQALAQRIGQGAEQVSQASRAAIRQIEQEVTAAKRDIEQERKQRGKDRVALEEEREKLKGKLAEILPAWLGNLIAAEEMVLLYPYFLFAGLAHALFWSWQTRRHYLEWTPALRAAGVDPFEAAMSSVWTPVNRGALGTSGSLLAYSAVATVALYCHWRGLELASGFHARNSGWKATAEAWLPVLQWATPLLLLAALTLLVIVLGADMRLRQPPERA